MRDTSDIRGVVDAGPVQTASPFTFRTDGLLPAQQFEAWRERWTPVVELEADPHPPSGGYRASNSVWDLDGIAVSRVQAPAVRARRAAGAVRRDPIDHWVLACARHGVTQTQADGIECHAAPGMPHLFSMAQPFDSQRSAIDWVVLFLPRNFAAQASGVLDRLANRTLETPTGRLLGDFMLALDHRLAECAAADFAALGRVVRQMVTACISLHPDRMAEAKTVLDEARLERLRRIVTQHLATPGFGAEQLGRLGGLSRSSLYRLFESEGGVARYILRQRLLAAQAALRDPSCRMPIHAVAEAVGFCDAASFSRSFRVAFGMTPRECRWLAASAACNPRHRGAFADSCDGSGSRLLSCLARAEGGAAASNAH